MKVFLENSFAHFAPLWWYLSGSGWAWPCPAPASGPLVAAAHPGGLSGSACTRLVSPQVRRAAVSHQGHSHTHQVTLL